jgi:hypothetical protein
MDAPTAPQSETNYEELVTFKVIAVKSHVCVFSMLIEPGKVQDQLYTRPRSRFADSSSAFKEILSTQGGPQAVIEVASCTKAQFESLLEIISQGVSILSG